MGIVNRPSLTVTGRLLSVGSRDAITPGGGDPRLSGRAAPGRTPRASSVLAGWCQRLLQVVLLVGVARELVQDVEGLVAHFLVEHRRLEAEGIEKDRGTASRSRFRLRCGQQARAGSVSPQVRADPEVLDPAGTAPGPPLDPGRDHAPVVADEDRQRLAVGEPRLLDVVVVEAVLEELDVLRRGLDFDCELPQVHGRYRASSSISDSAIPYKDRAATWGPI